MKKSGSRKQVKKVTLLGLRIKVERDSKRIYASIVPASSWEWYPYWETRGRHKVIIAFERPR